MIRLLARRAWQLCSCAALLAFSAAAFAQSSQFTLPGAVVTINGAAGCSSFTLGGSAGAPTLTCVPTGGGGGAFSCNLSGAPSGAIASGTAVNLAMNCSGGTTPYNYLWTPSGSNSPSISSNPTATTTYSVTATDNAGGSSTQAVTVTVSSGGGGGGGGLANCTNQGFTVITGNSGSGGTGVSSGGVVPWGTFAQSYSTASGNFGNNVVWLWTITASSQPTNRFGSFVISEYGGGSTSRQISVSTQPCDFSGSALSVSQFGNTATMYFGVFTPGVGYAGMTAGQTYYVSARNQQSSGPSCTTGNCTALMNINPASP